MISVYIHAISFYYIWDIIYPFFFKLYDLKEMNDSNDCLIVDLSFLDFSRLITFCISANKSRIMNLFAARGKSRPVCACICAYVCARALARMYPHLLPGGITAICVSLHPLLQSVVLPFLFIYWVMTLSIFASN